MATIQRLGTAILLAALFLTGCAVPPKPSGYSPSGQTAWHGRLAVRVESTPPQEQPQSFAAGFELSGNAQTGSLMLFTPLGNTVASLSWTAQTATLLSKGELREFDSLDALIKQTLGTEIPVAALFAWLAGENMQLAGWSADLSQHDKGRISARRSQPQPQAELRLVLDTSD